LHHFEYFLVEAIRQSVVEFLSERRTRNHG
jgi:hypothetical protein